MAQYERIAKLADTIWREHYIPIIGEAQVDYMLKKFQSEQAIADQVAEGFHYYVIEYDGHPVGYLSYIKDADDLFLSKIYVLSSFRGNKIGKNALLFTEQQAHKMNCNSIVLTVNKNNINSIKAYEKIGFLNRGPIVKDIGGGFIMDDYKMVKFI
jgi:ribosomal protein S18 acetylase RimI-like enzyme